MKKITAYITVGNRKGVHSRVATRIAEIAREFQVSISLAHQGESADAESILDVLSMALVFGSFVCLTIRGARATKAIPAVYETLINDDQ